ncbi:Transposase, type 1 [Cinara cedri]|uniref:Transposase, type 1 n=1 Tax=Cinara cedri TaxID=506608 RepID=A0A5E4M2S1_9HEMI|nr:Transposase, type 1 [Cinara cedri]
MADLREQLAAIKFCFLLGKTATETLKMLKTAYKGDVLGKTQVFEWFSRFKSGEMSIDDQARSGRSSTARTNENVEKIHKIILEDRRQTIEKAVERSGVTRSSVQRILSEDLGLRRVAAKFVPRLLIEQQKQGRVESCSSLKEEFQNDPDFFSKVITGDESWFYDPETKQQSSQWKTSASPRPKKARQVRSNIKTMLICFFDVKGVVHSEFIPPGQTVNQAFYLEVLKRLRNSLRRKRPDLWQSGDWFFHHDNAPAHTALSVRRFLTKNMTTVSHPPYSPDLSPCDFFLFPRIKRNMKGKRFADIDEVKNKTTEALAGITKDDLKSASKIGTKDWQMH